MSNRGFTLLETIMVIGITSIVMVALGFLLQYFYKTNAYILEQTQATNSARRSIDNAMRDLREASYGADGSYPIATTTTSSVTFYSDIEGNLVLEKVRYYLSGTALYRGVTEPAGNPPSYTGQPETVDLVVNNVRNGSSTPVFTYYDANGNQLAAPVNVTLITSINANVMTDVNPNRAPLVYSLPGSATLRNLRPQN